MNQFLFSIVAVGCMAMIFICGYGVGKYQADQESLDIAQQAIDAAKVTFLLHDNCVEKLKVLGVE